MHFVCRIRVENYSFWVAGSESEAEDIKKLRAVKVAEGRRSPADFLKE